MFADMECTSEQKIPQIRDYCLHSRLLYIGIMIPHAFLAHGYEREQELCSSIVGYCESCVMQITTRMRMLESRGELRAPFGTSGKYRRPIEHASSTLNSLFAIFFIFLIA